MELPHKFIKSEIVPTVGVFIPLNPIIDSTIEEDDIAEASCVREDSSYLRYVHCDNDNIIWKI